MRENTAYLYGQLTRDPICYKNPSTQELLSGQITIKTARRTNATGELFVKGRLRIDFITIYSRNEKLIREQFMSLRQGDIVLVKGSLSTQETEKKFICKKCGHEMIKHEAVVIYIDPLHIKKFASGLSTEEGLKEIENNIEISNEIMITGTLCREPAYYKENNIRNCQFQIAANRKRRIIEDGPEKRTDFPWIKTFGDMAEEISGVLHQGSVISICGGVETRSFERKIICENCGEEFERKEYATEIVPYFIDYAKKDALDIAKYQLKRNSAIKKVSVDITYPVKNEWTSGNYILVTVKAKIKTIAPIKTKIHKKQILVTIEGISGQSIVIPSNVAQTGILGGSDATNYTSWASRLGFDCRPVAQLWLKNPTYMDNIATINGLYCVAVKPTFGKTGDRIRVCLEDGQYFDCIMADVKGADATNPYGHVKGGKVSVVEFYAKGDPLNSASLASPIGKSSWLRKKVKKIINMGRYPGL